MTLSCKRIEVEPINATSALPIRCLKGSLVVRATLQTPGAEAVDEGFTCKNVLASYVHLMFASNPVFAAAIVERCRLVRGFLDRMIQYHISLAILIFTFTAMQLSAI